MSFADVIDTADRNAVLPLLGGVPVTYQVTGEGDVTPTGMFDENFVPLEPGESFMEQNTPSVWLKLADLPGDPKEDDPTFVIGGKTYRTRHREIDGPQGAGMRFWLHEVG